MKSVAWNWAYGNRLLVLSLFTELGLKNLENEPHIDQNVLLCNESLKYN